MVEAMRTLEELTSTDHSAWPERAYSRPAARVVDAIERRNVP